VTEQNSKLEIRRVPSVAAGPGEPLQTVSDCNLENLLVGVRQHSPYLARLLEMFPDQVARLKKNGPEATLSKLRQFPTISEQSTFEEVSQSLREAKHRVHLTLALLELGGIWRGPQIWAEFSKFADQALQTALDFLWHQEEKPSLKAARECRDTRSFFVVGFGKLGGHELNFSSDIDLAFFYKPQLFESDLEHPQHRSFLRLGRKLVQLISEVTEHGYVFRTDLRLRPDPSSTPIVLSTDAALGYYESVGQTWERAAWSKARIVAGNFEAGTDFLEQIKPFIWRRSLDFAAIEDVYQIKQQILSQSGNEDQPGPGFSLKIGSGSIREIELFVQTQQLIHGGRNTKLRLRSTLLALDQLVVTGLVTEPDGERLKGNYRFLRRVEHVIQMLADQQTHQLPSRQSEHKAMLGLLGHTDSAAFATCLQDCLRSTSKITGKLYNPDSEEPDAHFHITGLESHPESVQKLLDNGFCEPDLVLQQFRSWMAGQGKAMRSERARQMLEQLAADLIGFCAVTDSPDAAFSGFASFLNALPAGVQVLSVFRNCPQILEELLQVLALAPRLSETLARHPHMIEALVERPIDLLPDLADQLANAPDLEVAMNIARRVAKETSFLIGVDVLVGSAEADAIARRYTALAEEVIQGLARAVAKDLQGKFGPAPADWAILGAGKLGAREMMSGSDLDITLIYQRQGNETQDATIHADKWATRFTRRLITALSAPTSEGNLYEVDMKLRPSGSSGPVAVEFSSFSSYFKKDARTWEVQALCKTRIITASNHAFCQRLQSIVDGILAKPLSSEKIKLDMKEMRKLLASEKPASGLWDLKHGRGGLIELEFCLQAIKLLGSQRFSINSFFGDIDQLHSMCEAGICSRQQVEQLRAGHFLFHRLLQITNLAAGRVLIPANFSLNLKEKLQEKAGQESFEALEAKIQTIRHQIAVILDEILQL
jgi:glutamate-ammonia-ligase adenylyltransferase